MSLLLDALQRASQEKSGEQPRPPEGQESPVRPTSDISLQASGTQTKPENTAHESLSSTQPSHAPATFPALDEALHWPELIEPPVEKPAEAALTTPSLATLSLEPLQEAPSSPSTEDAPVPIDPPAMQDYVTASAPPALSPSPAPAPIPIPIAAPESAPFSPAETQASPQAPAMASTPSSATPDLAHTLLNASKAASPPSRKRAVILAAFAALILCSGIAAYLFLDLESLFMPGNTLSVAHPPPPSQTPVQVSSPVATEPAAPSEFPLPLPSPPQAHPQPVSAPENAEAPAKPAPPQVPAAAAPHKDQPPHPASSSRPAPVHPKNKPQSAHQTRQSPRPAPEQGTPPAASQAATPSIARRTAESNDIHQAYSALKQGRLDEARNAYQRVLQAQPEDRDALLGLATIAQYQERSDEARALYQRVLRQDPDNTTANAGLLALMAHDGTANTNTQASGLARDLTERHPRSAAAYATLGDLMVREGRLADAQQAYFKALALDAGNARYTYNLAVALDRLHKPEQALSYYERAIALSTKATTLDPIPQDIIRQRIEQLRPARANPSNAEAAVSP